jgi:magnesium transporter
VLHVIAFDARGHRVVEDRDEIAGLIAEDETVVWADITHPDDDELAVLRQQLPLHPLAIEDASKHGQRPKLEEFTTHAFIVAYAGDARTGRVTEIDLFVGANWFVTVHETVSEGTRFSMHACRERVLRTDPSHVTSSFLLYVVLDEIVDTYFAVIDRLADRIDAVEDRIFAAPDPERDEREIQRDMLALRKELLSFRRRVVPLREVLIELFREDVAWIDPGIHQYLQDVFDHVMRVTDELDTARELIGNAVDAHLAMVGNHQNQIMKKVTSWGAILIVASLIAGIYGMNFTEMPELRWRFGYPMALTTMLLSTVALYAYFKRKRWL